MFQLYLCFELSFVQTISFHYMFSFLHIPKMMMNVVTTSELTAKYSTFLFFLLFSIRYLLLFFSRILLPHVAFIYVHSFTFPFPLLFTISLQLHFIHSYYYEFQNFKNIQLLTTNAF